ncbi:MAG: hypothetical protein C0473_01480 [Cyanobacteria bacterium DS3.002]|nr:hypothetical protein [Cyanobacteria bacterium DS3.002]MBA4049605.1 hypothetical protein [Cyanobacteria bacterium DS2.008]MBA4076462.1 hypothetical protein [Cyanobacteria bacterium PR.023]
MPEELLSKLLENTDYRNDFLGKLKRKIEALVTISFYNVHFEILFFGKFNDVTFQNRLAEKPSWCRFCKKSVPEVTFTSIAHAIPESIGNRHIVCHNECDSCNTFFGRTIENDFGNWSKPHRTIAQISGKNGIPQLGRTKGKWNIKCVGDTTFIRRA